ncbi:MAG: YbaN family protein [Candidatus Zixiibacteriota bacterium]|nr:MAG: YbaN family protein [candidate division Zixibacteria bacterium]
MRGLLIVAGTLCVGLGVLGIFLPLLPTTPFLLLAAACYGSSSRRFYHWLLNNRWFGSYLRDYKEKKRIAPRVKVWAISLLWVTILFCAFIVVDILLVRIALILIAGGVTIHILRIRTLRP